MNLVLGLVFWGGAIIRDGFRLIAVFAVHVFAEVGHHSQATKHTLTVFTAIPTNYLPDY